MPAITVIGTLTSAAVASFQNQASVSVAGDANTANNTVTDTVAVSPAPDFSLAISNNSNSGCIEIGATATYTLTATNAAVAGQETSGPVTITDTLPASLSNPTVTGANWTTSLSGSTLVATYAVTTPLAPGANLPALTISGTISNIAASSLVNTATLSAPGELNRSDNSASSTISVCLRPDLTISKTHAGSGPFQVGQQVTYTLSVSNGIAAGSVDLGQDITVTDSIPAGLSNVTASGSSWNITTTSTTITATYTGSYPVNPHVTLSPITVTGILNSGAIGDLDNTATVSTPLDTDTANNSATDTLTVVPQPDLAITLSHQGNGPFQVGQSIAYILHVSNAAHAGPVQTGVPITVTDQLPAGLSNVIATGTNWNANTDRGLLTLTYAGPYPMNAGTTLPDILVSGQLNDAAVSTLSNTVTVNVTGDTNLSDNTATDSVPVLSLPDLQLHINSASGCVRQNDLATFTLSVLNSANAGPISAAHPVILTMHIPDGLEQVSFSGTAWQWQKNGSDVTATYIGSPLAIAPGQLLGSFEMTGKVTASLGGIVNLSAVAQLNNDSDTSNNTSTGKLTVCNFGNGGITQSATPPGNKKNNHGSPTSHSGHTGSANGGSGQQNYPGLPPTGSDPLAPQRGRANC